MNRWIMVWIVAGVLWVTGPAWADANSPRCINSQGKNVLWEEDSSINRVAESDVKDDGWPLVRYNLDILPNLRPQTRQYLYYHECGHHVLGHFLETQLTRQMEHRADCWAINTLIYSGVFQQWDVYAVQTDILRLSDVEWGRLGHRRIIDLESCLR